MAIRGQSEGHQRAIRGQAEGHQRPIRGQSEGHQRASRGQDECQPQSASGTSEMRLTISERHLGDEIDEREGRKLGDLTVVHLREEKP